MSNVIEAPSIWVLIQYKLTVRNIDIYTVNRDKKFWLNLVIYVGGRGTFRIARNIGM